MKEIYITVWTKKGKQELAKDQWYKFNTKQLHRLNGPAVEQADGTKWWYVNGKLHRTDGPAYESADGTKYWCINGKLNRLDGPAVEYADGTKVWWIDDKALNTKEVETWWEENKVDLKEPEGQMAFKLRWL